jgi:hypothetical protein
MKSPMKIKILKINKIFKRKHLIRLALIKTLLQKMKKPYLMTSLYKMRYHLTQRTLKSQLAKTLLQKMKKPYLMTSLYKMRYHLTQRKLKSKLAKTLIRQLITGLITRQQPTQQTLKRQLIADQITRQKLNIHL